MSDKSELESLAFEYVAGTLRGSARRDFEIRMKTDDTLRGYVRFWENSLMPDIDDSQLVNPDPDTYEKITQRLFNDNSPQPQKAKNAFSGLTALILNWKLPGVAATAFAFLFVGILATKTLLPAGVQYQTPNADYVAVLVDDKQHPVLTALTSEDGSRLWLKWESEVALTDSSLQLWAQSRRDGEIRPLYVFEGQQLNEIQLDEATWRLIKDSSHLIVTEEEIGGSAYDEPSEMIIAKGVCIRLDQKNS